MLKFVDDFLNRITMYRLVLYYLIFLLVVAEVLSAIGVLGYDPFALLFSIGFCWPRARSQTGFLRRLLACPPMPNRLTSPR